MLHLRKNTIAKKTLTLLMSVLALGLAGCKGGSDEPDVPEGAVITVKDASMYKSYGYSHDLTSWFDTVITFEEEVRPSIDQGELIVTFDTNHSGKFDEGDIRLQAGSVLIIGNHYRRISHPWGIRHPVAIDSIQNGVRHRVQEKTDTADVDGENLLWVDDIGGLNQRKIKLDKYIQEKQLTVRVNKNMKLRGSTGESKGEHLQAVLASIEKITPQTPVNVSLYSYSDNNGGSDYIPGAKLFSQQSQLPVIDPAGDYTGNDSWLDMVSVNFYSNKTQ